MNMKGILQKITNEYEKLKKDYQEKLFFFGTS